MEESTISLEVPIQTEKGKTKQEKREAELRLALAKAKEQELKLQKAIAKQEEERMNTVGMYGTVNEPRKSLSTYLRNQNKLEVSVIAILDRKAAILIRICTTVISALIVFHDYIDKNVTNGHTVSQILILGLLISLVMAILATKPFSAAIRRMYKKEILPQHPSPEENNFLFYNLVCLKEYQESMAKVVRSQNLQLGNQIRANYVLQRNNMYKAKMLDISYAVFLVTLVLVVIIFSSNNLHLSLGYTY